jgi:hypothetical protein
MMSASKDKNISDPDHVIQRNCSLLKVLKSAILDAYLGGDP